MATIGSFPDGAECLINALSRKVRTGTKISGNPTSQELTFRRLCG
jgi:hypothetical protein